MKNHFQQDCFEILLRRAAAGEISRRNFVKAASALLAVPLTLRGKMVFAADQLVLANWGGDAIQAYGDAFGVPFTEATGIPVRIDGSGPTEGAIQAQIASNTIIWDAIDADANVGLSLGNRGLLEALDYDKIDRAKIRPGWDREFVTPSYFFSYVLAYDSEMFGDEGPSTPADFWDVEKFPGMRTMYKWMNGMVEAALIADGVKPEELYPLDLDRALAKIAALKPDIISFWGSGAESQQLLMEGEAAMGYVWNTRASLLSRDTDGRIKWKFDNAFLNPSSWITLKGNPAGRDVAMDFIASTQKPESQVVLFEMLRNGPANPEADALIPEDQRHLNCVSPEAVAVQVQLDQDWYADNYTAALEKWLALVSA
ncbi:ABC transporter substrate-binding protein [Amaricoccus sp.]|uniref:ABC transporter substrate-binding protein n=1 Tax=Amaricoccus sp. TaxID=1872485 RepID=UPI001B47F5D1|nr:ABC transporter substrate-binding protein [Amaricoccus sp.]MBP7242832.1 ABC transporter substrate-binding protein [Amaricoccus sp.]